MSGSVPVCGDGIIQGPDEVCDDHNLASCGSCSADCQAVQSAHAVGFIVGVSGSQLTEHVAEQHTRRAEPLEQLEQALGLLKQVVFAHELELWPGIERRFGQAASEEGASERIRLEADDTLEALEQERLKIVATARANQQKCGFGRLPLQQPLTERPAKGLPQLLRVTQRPEVIAKPTRRV
jgi:cysteine-rich repeat protein